MRSNPCRQSMRKSYLILRSQLRREIVVALKNVCCPFTTATDRQGSCCPLSLLPEQSAAQGQDVAGDTGVAYVSQQGVDVVGNVNVHYKTLPLDRHPR